MLSAWKPFGLTGESALADFHELRQDFSPPNLEAGKMLVNCATIKLPN